MMSKNINTDIMKYFSYNISYLRRKHSISKKKMCEILGIGVSSLNKIEQGILPPRLNVEVLFRIQSYFGVPASIQVSERIT